MSAPTTHPPAATTAAPGDTGDTPSATRRGPGLRARLEAPADLAGLAVARMLLGAILLWEVWRYVDAGWIARYYVDPVFNFTYAGFGWVTPLPAAGMIAVFAGLGVLAVLFAVGAWFRVSGALLTLGYTYVFLLEQARYLNHFYLLCVVTFLLTCTPAHRLWSVDAAARPGLRADVAPEGWLWLLRAQLAVVYTYAGLAKLNSDWLGGEPMRSWLAARTDFPLVGRFFTDEAFVLGAARGGALFDLLVVPALLWRRTRTAAVLASAVFHLSNEQLFQIGVFPWFALAMTTVFFAPDWPRRLFARLPWGHGRPATSRSATVPRPATPARRRLAAAGVAALVAFMSVQALAPARQLVVPGDVAWTEEGHRFSWRMKLRTKSAEAAFLVTDLVTGQQEYEDLRDHLTGWQYRSMASRPDMLAQFARRLRAHHEADGRDVEVRAVVTAALNGREPAPLLDPTVDLSRVPRFAFGRDWVLPP